MRGKWILPISLFWLFCGFNLYFSFAQDEYLIPGDARKGWQIFATKGCIKCHSIAEEGEKIGPDLSKTPSHHLSAAGLAAEMWNHAPDMWEQISVKGIKIKRFTKAEMADLFAFLYFIRYLDEPGNTTKGKESLQTKRCAECHEIGDKGEKVGPDLTEWTQYTNPILWAQMMWNHAMKMKEEMEEEAIPWPKLEGNDMVNIIAYIRSVGNTGGEKVFLSPGDALEGKILFSQKGCYRCHAIQGQGGKIGPDLGTQKKDFPPTLGQLAGLMWNHLPEMLKEMKKGKIKKPELSAKDMANITAYLFSVRYFDPLGNRSAGEKIFREKKCSTCHHPQKGEEKPEGPNLAKLEGKVSPIYMAKALWNHGPKMLAKMEKKHIEWQKITYKELIHLMEYLNSGIERGTIKIGER